MFFLRQQISVYAEGSCVRNIGYLLLRGFLGLIDRLLSLILLNQSLRGRSLYLLLSSLHLIVAVIVAVVLIRDWHRRWLVSLRNHLLLLVLLHLNLLFDFEFIIDAFK